MKVDPRVEMSAPVAPVIKRIPGNPVLSVNVKTEGCLNPVSLNAVNLDFSGTARLADIESVTVVRGGEKPEFPEGAVTFPEDPGPGSGYGPYFRRHEAPDFRQGQSGTGTR